MTKFKTCLAIAAFATGVSAHAACDYPMAPEELPNGETETEEEMLTAQKAVKGYVKRMEDYLACLDEQLAAKGEDATDEHRLMHEKRYNAAVDILDATASEFNQAVRTYQARDN